MRYVIVHNFYPIFRVGNWGWSTDLNKAKIFNRRPLSQIQTWQHPLRNQETVNILGYDVFFRDFEIRRIEINLL